MEYEHMMYMLRIYVVATEGSFDKVMIYVRVNNWKYINNLMDVGDGCKNSSTQDKLCHSTSLPGWVIADHVHTHAQAATKHDA